MRPRLLDLFCCAGAGAMGYARAGFDVVGVDNDARHGKVYPYEFHQGDALDYLAAHWQEFDAIHASPPCQSYSITRHGHSIEHPALVEGCQDVLRATGLPYVIENVVGAPLLDPIMLCGSHFGLGALDSDGVPLRLERHRLFESSIPLSSPGDCSHNRSVQVAGVYGGGRTGPTPAETRFRARHLRKGGYVPADKRVLAALLGIDWPAMTKYQLYQALPPVYTHFIGLQVAAHLLLAPMEVAA